MARFGDNLAGALPEGVASETRRVSRQDVYGLRSSTGSPDAQRAFETAVHGLAAHQPSTGKALEATLAADPEHVGAHALKGFANLILARAELMAPAAAALADARQALRNAGGGSADERHLVEALALAVDGSFAGAAARLDAAFAGRPVVFLPFKIAHALRFMLGDKQGMLAASRNALRGWSATAPGAGFVLGCHAFALEEHGFYGEAETIGRRAVALQPDDAWGLHAVSHVHEMRGETETGIAWLETSRGAWSRCNNFSFHMAWHLALLHLERGEHERVLDVYDREVRPVHTDDFRDMANAVSLLWRLERSGVAVGGRWAELAEIALKRRSDTTLVFAALHNLIALVAVGNHAAAGELLAALEARAAGEGDQSKAAADVGVPLARLLVGRPDASGQAAARLAAGLPHLGGSNAQRDLFMLSLAHAAAATGDAAALGDIGAVRGRLKAQDRLFDAVQAHAAH